MVSRKRLRAIVSEIRDFCESNADEAQVQKYARFFTEGYDAYGLSKDVYLEKKERFIEESRSELSFEDALKLGDLLLQSGKYEEAFLAIALAEAHRERFTRQTFQRLGEWLETGIHNWAHTDVLCGNVISPLLLAGTVELDDLASWRESPSKWRRRAVPVAMIEPMKTRRGVKPLLNFIAPMMLDEDRFVQQGLGWFLRETWKKRPKPVETFLLKWKETAPRKIYQYATEKMTQEQKARFKRARKK